MKEEKNALLHLIKQNYRIVEYLTRPNAPCVCLDILSMEETMCNKVKRRKTQMTTLVLTSKQVPNLNLHSKAFSLKLFSSVRAENEDIESIFRCQ